MLLVSLSGPDQRGSAGQRSQMVQIRLEISNGQMWAGPVQCFAGYFDIEYGHLLDGEKQMGVIINTCKEFNLLPLNKGYLPIRATPPSRLGINP